jgi:hypothetical protein
MPSGDEPFDDETIGAFDDDRQGAWVTVVGEPIQGRGDSLFGVGERPPVEYRSAVVQHGHVMSGAGPIPADEHRTCFPSVAWSTPSVC